MEYQDDSLGTLKARLAFNYLAPGILAAIVLAGCSPIGFFPVNTLHAMSQLPPQGVYESCPPHKGTQCLDHLSQIARAGFRLVLNYDQLNGTVSQELAYAATAQALHIKIIWGMSNPVFWNGTELRRYYPELGATCACTDNKGFIAYVVGLVRHLPATWGYYVGDEVDPADHHQMNAVATLVHRLDPLHPRLYIAEADPRLLGTKLEPFADSAEVIGADYYPISTGASIGTVGPVAQAIQSVADQNGRQSAFVLQAFSWGQYPGATWVCSPFPHCARYPTEAEMRQMRDLVLSYAHPAMLLWYSFFNVLRSDDPARHWSDLVAAAGVHGSLSYEKLSLCDSLVLRYTPILHSLCLAWVGQDKHANGVHAQSHRDIASVRLRSPSVPP